MFISLHPNGWHVIFICPFPTDIYFDHLIKVVPARFYSWKYFPPLLLINNLRLDIWNYTNISCLKKILSFGCTIHWRFFHEIILIRMTLKQWLFKSIIPSTYIFLNYTALKFFFSTIVISVFIHVNVEIRIILFYGF